MAQPSSAAASSHTGCPHAVLTSSPSSYALSLGHQHYTEQQILTAITGKRKHAANAASQHHLASFPAPLLLPGDAIVLDPRYPQQSFRSWVNEGARNQVTARRPVIYVAAPPEIDRSDQQAAFLTDVDVRSLISYLQAFYHGLEVKNLPVSLTFTSWGKSPKSKAGTNSRRPRDVKAVALSTGAEAIRIRVRSTPPPGSGSSDAFPYSQQLNLDDMTDVALSVLPSDAYALLLLTTHDTYESEDDDFCCGRAWGASRVAIVSSARYQPSLDDAHGVDRGHIWPASHCSDFVDKMNIGGSQDDEPRHERNGAKRRRTGRQPASGAQSFVVSSPLEKAVDAHRTSSPAAGLSVLDISSMFLFRLCRTASHELGHCFGLDHCMYKACVMQGTASVAEDMRQPPYLCSVCEAKVAWAIVRGDTSGAKAELETRSRATRATRATERAGTKHLAQTEDNKREIQLAKWKRDKYEAMKTFCEQVSGGAFAPLLAWSAALQ